MSILARIVSALLLSCLATAALAHPGASIHVTADGRVFFIDTGGGVFVIGRDGKLVRQPGPGFHWFALDEASGLAKTPWPAIPGAEITAVGLHPTVVLSSDFPDAVGADGALYFAQLVGQERWDFVRIAPSGARSIHAHFPTMKRSNGDVQYVNGLAATPGGNLYFTNDRSVHRIDAKGKVTTLVRDVAVEGCARIPGVEDYLGPYLRGLAVAPNGTVFVAAAGCGAVLMISPKGRVTTVLHSTPPYSPTAVAVAKGEIYVLEYLHDDSDDRLHWLPRVRKITSKGTIEVLVRTTR